MIAIFWNAVSTGMFVSVASYTQEHFEITVSTAVFVFVMWYRSARGVPERAVAPPRGVFPGEYPHGRQRPRDAEDEAQCAACGLESADCWRKWTQRGTRCTVLPRVAHVSWSIWGRERELFVSFLKQNRLSIFHAKIAASFPASDVTESSFLQMLKRGTLWLTLAAAFGGESSVSSPREILCLGSMSANNASPGHNAYEMALITNMHFSNSV